MLEPERIRAVADIAARHDLLVISDEIYDRLVYGGHRHEAFSALPDMRDRTILLGGFSKAYAMTGWRVGYACAPRDLLEGILKIHQYQIMSAPTTAQDAALVALTAAEPDVQRMVAEYDRRRQMFVEGLNRIGLPTVEPKGAFYAFPQHQWHGPHQRAVQRAAAVRPPGRRGARVRVRPIGRGFRASQPGHQLRGPRDRARTHRAVHRDPGVNRRVPCTPHPGLSRPLANVATPIRPLSGPYSGRAHADRACHRPFIEPDRPLSESRMEEEALRADRLGSPSFVVVTAQRSSASTIRA